MSMDGIDLACADIHGDFPYIKVERIGEIGHENLKTQYEV